LFFIFNYGIINVYIGEGVLSVGYNGDKVIEGITTTTSELIKAGASIMVEKEKHLDVYMNWILNTVCNNFKIFRIQFFLLMILSQRTTEMVPK